MTGEAREKRSTARAAAAAEGRQEGALALSPDASEAITEAVNRIGPILVEARRRERELLDQALRDCVTDLEALGYPPSATAVLGFFERLEDWTNTPFRAPIRMIHSRRTAKSQVMRMQASERNAS